MGDVLQGHQIGDGFFSGSFQLIPCLWHQQVKPLKQMFPAFPLNKLHFPSLKQRRNTTLCFFLSKPPKKVKLISQTPPPPIAHWFSFPAQSQLRNTTFLSGIALSERVVAFGSVAEAVDSAEQLFLRLGPSDDGSAASLLGERRGLPRVDSKNGKPRVDTPLLFGGKGRCPSKVKAVKKEETPMRWRLFKIKTESRRSKRCVGCF